eukprot:c39800_g1_i1 orf=2-292(-)
MSILVDNSFLFHILKMRTRLFLSSHNAKSVASECTHMPEHTVLCISVLALTLYVQYLLFSLRAGTSQNLETCSLHPCTIPPVGSLLTCTQRNMVLLS